MISNYSITWLFTWNCDFVQITSIIIILWVLIIHIFCKYTLFITYFVIIHSNIIFIFAHRLSLSHSFFFFFSWRNSLTLCVITQLVDIIQRGPFIFLLRIHRPRHHKVPQKKPSPKKKSHQIMNNLKKIWS